MADLNDLALILAAAFVGGALIKTLKQPVLVGYILVGALFGPTGLGLVTDTHGIQWLAELGILLLMFYIGLEIDLAEFRAVARPAVLTTLMQILVGLGTMYLIGMVVGWSLRTTFLMGCGVALSSSAVAIKIFDTTGIKQTPRAQAGMGVLVAQDIAIIPIMLIWGALTGTGGIQVVGLAKLIVGMLVLGLVFWLASEQPRWFMPWARRVAKLKARAMHGQAAITALAFCFASAALAGAYGLSAAYGAFLAGLALSRTKSREKLHKTTQPIFDVLIMVFFLSVGLLIDLKFTAQHWIVILELVVAIVLIKTLVNFLVLRSQGIESKNALFIGALTSQIGEFSFLLAAMGLKDQSIGEDAYRYVVAAISISLMTTPLWLLLLSRLRLIAELKPPSKGHMMERMARQIV